MTGKELKKKLIEHGLSAGKEGEEYGVLIFKVYELYYGKILVKIYSFSTTDDVAFIQTGYEGKGFEWNDSYGEEMVNEYVKFLHNYQMKLKLDRINDDF
jgi:hypothetical protein